MRPLKTALKMNGGHTYRQVWRDKDFAIYEQHGHYNQLLGYEVIRIQHNPAETLFGREYPEREVYPSSEQWGTHAFTVNSLEQAHKHIETWKQTPIPAEGVKDGE